MGEHLITCSGLAVLVEDSQGSHHRKAPMMLPCRFCTCEEFPETFLSFIKKEMKKKDKAILCINLAKKKKRMKIKDAFKIFLRVVPRGDSIAHVNKGFQSAVCVLLDHHAHATESRVLLHIITDIPQRKAPRNNEFLQVGGNHIWCNET